ncbi:hypothetical protein HAX54_015856 [Datura stramonium]|uniref:DUF7898 domain-containing protein n=1 Tax=Datura stramonium TaxID=4076 RepID=A0ABS8UK39_DATST|nr:hypothetical protein [Datura stramonium]
MHWSCKGHGSGYTRKCWKVCFHGFCFCERELGWHDLEGLVSKFQNRVSFGVRAEIVELTTIPFVKGSRARALYKAGFRTPEAIAEASVPEIVKVLFESSSWADQGSAQRRIQLGVAKKIKNVI